MRAEQSWSLLDPKPVLLYLKKHDEYIVYWNGIAMTHGQALCMAMESSASIYATPEMKMSLQKTFEKLYYANAFGTRSWDSRISSGGFVYESQKRWMQDHLNKHVKDKAASEVLGWFDYSRARKEEHV
jgi:hypothetical protein